MFALLAKKNVCFFIFYIPYINSRSTKKTHIIQIQRKSTKKNTKKKLFKFNAGALICEARGGCHKDILYYMIVWENMIFNYVIILGGVLFDLSY